MEVAKLSDGRLVELLKSNQQVQFDATRTDWCLVFTPIGSRPRQRNLFWVPATYIVWRIKFA